MVDCRKMRTVNGKVFFGVARSLALKTELLDLSARALSLCGTCFASSREKVHSFIFSWHLFGALPIHIFFSFSLFYQRVQSSMATNRK